jgi:hypothetical protein
MSAMLLSGGDVERLLTPEACTVPPGLRALTTRLHPGITQEVAPNERHRGPKGEDVRSAN